MLSPMLRTPPLLPPSSSAPLAAPSCPGRVHLTRCSAGLSLVAVACFAAAALATGVLHMWGGCLVLSVGAAMHLVFGACMCVATDEDSPAAASDTPVHSPHGYV